MPSFDFTSEADMVALKNAIDVAARQIECQQQPKTDPLRQHPSA